MCSYTFKVNPYKRFCNETLLFDLNVYSAALGKVCMKLVIVMGLTWAADVLSWVHTVWNSDSNSMKNSNMHSISGDIRYYFWYIMDEINALQGVLIFLVVASQPQVSKLNSHHNILLLLIVQTNNISLFLEFHR